jgi:hypothetical protein
MILILRCHDEHDEIKVIIIIIIIILVKVRLGMVSRKKSFRRSTQKAF